MRTDENLVPNCPGRCPGSLGPDIGPFALGFLPKPVLNRPRSPARGPETLLSNQGTNNGRSKRFRCRCKGVSAVTNTATRGKAGQKPKCTRPEGDLHQSLYRTPGSVDTVVFSTFWWGRARREVPVGKAGTAGIFRRRLCPPVRLNHRCGSNRSPYPAKLDFPDLRICTIPLLLFGALRTPQSNN